MVLMRWWPLGLATSMPIIWLFFPGYTWIEIVHDSEGSLIMDHDFCLWSFITRFHRHWTFIVIVLFFLWNLNILFLEILLFSRYNNVYIIHTVFIYEKCYLILYYDFHKHVLTCLLTKMWNLIVLDIFPLFRYCLSSGLLLSSTSIIKDFDVADI